MSCSTTKCRDITLVSITTSQVLSQIEQGDPSAAEQLLPLVYEELRKLAAQNRIHLGNIG
ncbi:MAG: ECF-type sigma factor [Fuerstiella sp.]